MNSLSIDGKPFLVNERPLHILPSLARIFNVNGAVVLQQTHWVTSIKKAKQDQWTFWEGEWWCSYSQSDWQSRVLPWVNLRTVSQVLTNLVKQGVLICAKPFAHNTVDKKNKNQVRWYRVNYEVLAQKLGENDTATMTQILHDRDEACQPSQGEPFSPFHDDANFASSAQPQNESFKPALTKGFSDSHDDANFASSSIYKKEYKNNKKSACEFSSNFEGNAKAENLDLSEPDVNQTSPVLPKNLTNGIGSNQEIPAENKFSAAPPENLPKAEAFAWWGERFEDPIFLRRKVESWAWDLKFLQNFGEWLLKDQAHWAKNGYTAQSAAQTVVRGSLYGEKAGAHRGRLATYLCKDCQSPTPATTPQPVAPSAPAAPVSEYAELIDSQVTDQFLGQWQEIQAFPTKIREAMATAIQDSYTREFQRRYGQNWAGATLPELATTLQIAA